MKEVVNRSLRHPFTQKWRKNMYSKIKIHLLDIHIQMVEANPSFMVSMWESLLMSSGSGDIVSMGIADSGQILEILLDQYSVPFKLLRALSCGVFKGCLLEVFVKTSDKIGYMQFSGDGGEYFWFCDNSCLDLRNIIAVGFDNLVEVSELRQCVFIPREHKKGNAVSFSSEPGDLQVQRIRDSVIQCKNFEANISIDPVCAVIYENSNERVMDRLLRNAG